VDDQASGHLIRILQRLDGRLSVAEIAQAEGIPESEVEMVVDQLTELSLLEKDSSHALDYYLDQILPNLTAHEGKRRMSPSSVVALGDPYLSEQIVRILTSSNVDGQFTSAVADPSLRVLLSKHALSQVFDRLDFEEAAQPFAEWSGQLAVFAVSSVNPLEVRAFNRICLRHRIPWIHAAVDGPSLLIGPTFIPFRSPCYECLEARALMKMRDSASYQRYKSALLEGRVVGTGAPLDSALGSILSSLTAFEALNFLLTGTSFTVCKLLAMYLPTMEFTFNDVLRLPGCAACGSSPVMSDQELYFDLRTLLTDPPPGKTDTQSGTL
jgi:bacteriocin biosynthesis cyclodehydratase domain-containing protein